MPRKYRKRVDPAKKVEALQRHLVKNEPVSEICEELGVQPSVFYTWQKEFFSRGASVFEVKPGPKKTDHSGEKIESLEAKIRRKDEVIAELLEEHVSLKKSLGVN